MTARRVASIVVLALLAIAVNAPILQSATRVPGHRASMSACCRNGATCPMHRHLPAPKRSTSSLCRCDEPASVVFFVERGAFRNRVVSPFDAPATVQAATVVVRPTSLKAAPPSPPPRPG